MFLIRYLLLENRAAGRTHSVTRGVHIFEKPCCREIRAMGGRVMRGLPVVSNRSQEVINKDSEKYCKKFLADWLIFYETSIFWLFFDFLRLTYILFYQAA